MILFPFYTFQQNNFHCSRDLQYTIHTGEMTRIMATILIEYLDIIQMSRIGALCVLLFLYYFSHFAVVCSFLFCLKPSTLVRNLVHHRT